MKEQAGTRILMLAWMALFLTGIASGEKAALLPDLGQDKTGLISMTKIAEKVMDFEFYNKFNHYNKDQLVFITDSEIISLRLDLNFSVQYKTPHNIPNLKTDYVHSKMDHSGYIFIFTKDKIYVFNDNYLGQMKKDYKLEDLNKQVSNKIT